jgi:DNA-binding transcriptional regulator YiaG
MSLAHYALVHTRSWAVNSSNDRARLSAKKDQLDQEIRLLREEIRIKDERLARIPASQRPHYRPTERLAILELRALRGWSMAQTARVFHVTQATIASWGKRLDEQGPAALLRTPVPVNSVEVCIQRGSTEDASRSPDIRSALGMACWPRPGRSRPPARCDRLHAVLQVVT